MKNIDTLSLRNNNTELSESSPQNIATNSPSERSLSPHKDDAIRNSLLAGSVAGVTSTIACHPFDVLRVKMQTSAPAAMTTTNSRAAGLLGTLRDTLRCGGGLRALYTGLAMPLAAQAVYKGTVFTINNMTESFIKDRKNQKNSIGGIEKLHKLTLTDRFISGCLGGAVNAALFCTPVEYVRNQQIVQIQNRGNPTEPAGNAVATSQNTNKSGGNFLGSRNPGKNGPISIIQRTVRGNGFAGLWRGMASTVLRDSVGCGVFFVAMAYSQEQLTPECSTRSPNKAVVILSGALAGVSYWLWALPVDTMKTWIQNGTARDLSDAVRISQRNGIAQTIPSLFRGWQVAYSRGAPSAAITVLTYSVAFQFLQELP
eukprot:CAMPEP_0197198838 /NCGR_PEP_ID=MMETSP1423-20130617/33574_1 /TAXON_ID=476441 /ORGANISM="Pseudo-nitzschia heimii, Strain UNC1101" /LENGTH=370 /DNA_ID=CAMNT_0042652677 /DNA_START=280 /DNA_END=1392 /DNA_ORIENTATION=-